MGYESSALLVGFAAQVGKGPAKAQEFVGSPRGTQTSVCLYRRAEMPLLVQRPWMYQVCEDTVFSAIPSFGWVFLPGSNPKHPAGEQAQVQLLCPWKVPESSCYSLDS